MIVCLIVFALLLSGLALLFRITPQQVTNGLMRVVAPRRTLRTRVEIARGKKKESRVASKLKQLQSALEVTGKGGQFVWLCTLSLILFAFGCVLAAAIGNFYLLPVIAAALALAPFVYAGNLVKLYDKHLEAEMETALSIVTTAYLRSDDIVTAVSENLDYIKPPMSELFRAFVGEATVISSDLRAAILRLKERTDNEIFREWCDMLLLCQDDRSLQGNLLPIVMKYADVRRVNSELKTMVYEPRKEYFMMLAMLVGSIPLLYLLNRDWYGILIHTTAGKITLAVCGVIALATGILMVGYTKPIKYRR